MSGWDWTPDFFAPLTHLATQPIRWLPDHLKLPALNVLAAGCAALVLVLLARSVALLPHDRTNEQRLRQNEEASLLTIPTAWLPPLFAVLACGLQMTFWERSVQWVDLPYFDCAEMLNLLLFAYIIRNLLEYRVSQRDAWLMKGAFVFGLGMANNWAMIAFFPLFGAAIVWLKGFEFFQWRSVVRMLGCGVAGLCLIFLLPIIVRMGQYYPGIGFFKSLRYVLATDRVIVINLGAQWKWLMMLSMTSLIPVLLMSIKWATSFGDNSPLGITLASSAMKMAHGFFLVVCLWMLLDPPFGPRQADLPVAVRLPFLTYFYLVALCIGYFCGYFLLVFGSRVIRQRHRTPPAHRWFNTIIVVAVWVLAFGVPVILAVNNLPRIREGLELSQATERYYSRVQNMLPAENAVILSDYPGMLFNLQAYQARRQSTRQDIFIDTAALAGSWKYVSELERKHPAENLGGVFTSRTNSTPFQVDCIHLAESLYVRHPIFYLQPSFGYYFERFYEEPRGLAYQLYEHATNDWIAPPLSAQTLAENKSFWTGCSNDLVALMEEFNQKLPEPTNDWERFTQTAFFAPETNGAAAELAQIYSRALNAWGVSRQRAGSVADPETLAETAGIFKLAAQLNPENGPALVNLDYNEGLRENRKTLEQSFASIEEKLPGIYRQWYDEIAPSGPFDEPNFCGEFARQLRIGKNVRQAILQFQRQEQLLPSDPGPPLQLAETYLAIPTFPMALNYAFPSAGACFFDAAAAGDRVLRLAPDQTNALNIKALSLLELGTYLPNHPADTERPYPPGNEAYSNFVTTADKLLQLAPDNPRMHFFRSEVLVQLNRSREAIPDLSHLIDTQTNNVMLYFSRAVAYYQSRDFAAAKSDYEQVIKQNPTNFQAFFGLGEIAYTNRNYPEALSNYERYLTNAPTNWWATPEFKTIQERVDALRKRAR